MLLCVFFSLQKEDTVFINIEVYFIAVIIITSLLPVHVFVL